MCVCARVCARAQIYIKDALTKGPLPYITPRDITLITLSRKRFPEYQ